MDINNFGQARAAIIDRNPVVKNALFNGDFAPDFPTTRATYTVGVGKKAVINTLYMFLERSQNASAIGLSSGLFFMTRASGGFITLLTVSDDLSQVHDTVEAITSPQTVLLEGDKVDLQTFDLSTGGFVFFNGSIVVTEFDA